MTPIAKAVQPLKEQAVSRAQRATQARIEEALNQLQSNGWDLNVVAPIPHGRMSRADYRQAAARRDFMNRITNSSGISAGSRRLGAPDLRKPDADGIAKLVAEAAVLAANDYDAFVAKLEYKVGPHSAAEMLTNSTWSYSIVKVETPAGKQHWKTQTIVNVSSLGKLFNQWPTRLMKGE